jgi:hypothetical protein
MCKSVFKWLMGQISTGERQWMAYWLRRIRWLVKFTHPKITFQSTLYEMSSSTIILVDYSERKKEILSLTIIGDVKKLSMWQFRWFQSRQICWCINPVWTSYNFTRVTTERFTVILHFLYKKSRSQVHPGWRGHGSSNHCQFLDKPKKEEMGVPVQN